MLNSKTHSENVTLITLAAGHMVNDWVAGTIWIIAPAIAASMGLGPVEVGLLLTVNGIAAGLVYIPAGILADRISQQGILMMISFWWVAIGYFCATLAPGFWPVTLLLGLGVMGDAFWHPVATGVLVKRMPKRRAQVLGIHAMGGSIGAEMLGPISAGFLLGYFDWRVSLQILIIPPMLMGILFIPIVKGFAEKTKTRVTRSDIVNLIRRWSTPQGVGMVSMMIAYNMALFGMLAMTPLVLQTIYLMNPLNSGIVFAGMLLMGTLFQPFIGILSDRVGRKSVIVFMILIAAGFALCAAVFSSFVIFISVLVISTSLLTAVRPVILAAAVEYSGKSEATTLGLVFAILDGVGALGALFAGYAGKIELTHAYLLCALLALAAAVITMVLQFKPLLKPVG